MALSAAGYAIAAAAAAAAGAVNALAGGGTLITFPVLTALGLPAVSANVTNTIALLPGYLGGSWAQRSILARPEHGRRLAVFLPVSALGGLVGALLLFLGGEKVFSDIVPYLILFAAGLLAFGERIKRRLGARAPSQSAGVLTPARGPSPASVLAIALSSVYAGYFGAGASVISLAVLALALEGPLSELNAIKQAISLASNLAAAIVFSFSGKADWIVVGVMAVSALAGGLLGGAFAGRLKGPALRLTVVLIGVAVGVFYLVRG